MAPISMGKLVVEGDGVIHTRLIRYMQTYMNTPKYTHEPIHIYITKYI